ncbi:hypothetical protein CEXT_521401, partial [Caerostris extrusa]
MTNLLDHPVLVLVCLISSGSLASKDMQSMMGLYVQEKSVCCARLRVIEDHEEHLKSLSPYFNDP